jgi:hypothetical protein
MGTIEDRKELIDRARDMGVVMGESEADLYLKRAFYNVYNALNLYFHDHSNSPSPRRHSAMNLDVDNNGNDDDDEGEGEGEEEEEEEDDDDDEEEEAIESGEDDALNGDGLGLGSKRSRSWSADEGKFTNIIQYINLKCQLTHHFVCIITAPSSPEGNETEPSPFQTPTKNAPNDVDSLTYSMGSANLNNEGMNNESPSGNDSSAFRITTATSTTATSTSTAAAAAEASVNTPDDEKKMSAIDQNRGEPIPSDLPPGAVSVQYTPRNGDMRVYPGKNQSGDALHFRLFARELKPSFDAAVLAEDQKPRIFCLDTCISVQDMYSLVEKWPGRVAALEWCRSRLREHPDEFYFKSSNGLCYQVLPKDHFRLIHKLFEVLCNMTYDPVEAKALHQQNIQYYLDAIMSGQVPLYSSAFYGGTKKRQSKEKSISCEQNTNLTVYFREDYAQREFGERWIDDVWTVCSTAEDTYAQFATRRRIIEALGGQYTDIVGVDESLYHGTIITDLEAFRKRMNCVSFGELLVNMKNWFRTALCNPNLASGWVVTTSDVFIFHREEFFDGIDGKQSTFDCKIEVTKKFAGK